MNKSMMIGAALGAVAVIGGGAVAGYKYMTPPEPQYAEVLSVIPVSEKVTTPEQECRDVKVSHRRAVQDEHRVAGSVIGGVLGGVLGHQVGSGRGNDVATAAGAIAGGYAGNQVQKDMQNNDRYSTTEKRCKTVNKTVEKQMGYDVKYSFNGQVASVRADYIPVGRIPVKNGQLQLASANPTKAPMSVDK
jgi:uncharacterized protein YcfJ